MRNLFRNKPFTIALILFLLLLLYLVVRVITIPLADDEAISVIVYSRLSLRDILTNNYDFLTANNHLLNTLLIKLITVFTPHSEFMIRLPNIIGFCLFFWSTFGIISRTRLNLLLLFIVTINPYLLEFFSLARGYGLALGLIFVSCFLLIKLSDEFSLQTVHLAFEFAILAVLANFTMLYSFIIITGLLVVLTFKQKGMRIIHTTIWVTSLLISMYVVFMLLQVKKYGDLIHGGSSNFVVDTLSSLISSYIQQEQSIAITIGAVILLIMIVLIGAQVITKLVDKDWAWLRKDGLIPLVLIGNVIAINLHFYILNIPLYQDRTASFLLPLILIAFAQVFTDKKLFNWGWQGLVLILVVINFASVAKVQNFYVYGYDRYNIEIIKSLDTKSVGIDYRLIQSMLFYQEKFDLQDIDIGQINLINPQDFSHYQTFIAVPETYAESPEWADYAKQLTVTKEYDNGVEILESPLR